VGISSQDSVIEKIAQCAVDGKETVLLVSDARCEPPSTGGGAVKDISPVDALWACSYDNRNDKRVLSEDAIKRIARNETKQAAQHAKKEIAPIGIRIIGAIFCRELDLTGLNLPYSLVIDKSIFVSGITARNFHTSGDLSFYDGQIFGQLWIGRSRIDGTIFGDRAFIQKAQVLDSLVGGSLLFRESVSLEPAIFDTITLSGELSLRKSTSPYFLLQFSKVGGVLDLTESRAGCAYQLAVDEIGALVAVDAGLGFRELADKNLSRFFEAASDKAETTDNDFRGMLQLREFRSLKDAASAYREKGCAYPRIASPNVFVVSDSTVKARLCLRSFHWPSMPDGKQESDLTFNDVVVGGTTFIDLIESGSNTGTTVKGAAKRQFTMLGFQTNSLIFNFGTPKQLPSYTSSYVNGLKFEQVYSAAAPCSYDPNFARKVPAGGSGDATGRPNLSSIGNLSALQRPGVDDVTRWLGESVVRTTQPLAAFIDVFQKNGEDDSAKQLRIAKASAELRRTASRMFSSKSADDNAEAAAATGNSSVLAMLVAFVTSVGASIWNTVITIPDYVAVFLGYALKLLADSGYRPEKVGWAVLGVMATSAIYFWFLEGVVAIKPEKKDLLRPIGVTFLFDRLLPAYQIREDHYKIESFMRRAGKGDGTFDGEFRYLWFKLRVVKLEPGDKAQQRVELALDFIKFVGLVLAIFLVAALNSLVNH